MSLGDFGNVVLPSSSSSDLCLFKFYPASNCKIRLSCDSFSVSSSFSSSLCPSKVITKADTSPASRWCGSETPPGRSSPLISSGPLLFGYMALYPGRQGEDSFRCSVGCVRAGSSSTGSSSSPGTVNCRCGTVSSRVRRRKVTKKPTLLSALQSVRQSLRQSSLMTRIIGGVSAAVGSVPWQASLAVAGEILAFRLYINLLFSNRQWN